MPKVYGPNKTDPEWFLRAEFLKKKLKCSDDDLAARLNQEGYLSVHGKAITADKIRCRRKNRKVVAS